MTRTAYDTALERMATDTGFAARLRAGEVAVDGLTADEMASLAALTVEAGETGATPLGRRLMRSSMVFGSPGHVALATAGDDGSGTDASLAAIHAPLEVSPAVEAVVHATAQDTADAPLLPLAPIAAQPLAADPGLAALLHAPDAGPHGVDPQAIATDGGHDVAAASAAAPVAASPLASAVPTLPVAPELHAGPSVSAPSAVPGSGTQADPFSTGGPAHAGIPGHLAPGEDVMQQTGPTSSAGVAPAGGGPSAGSYAPVDGTPAESTYWEDNLTIGGQAVGGFAGGEVGSELGPAGAAVGGEFGGIVGGAVGGFVGFTLDHPVNLGTGDGTTGMGGDLAPGGVPGDFSAGDAGVHVPAGGEVVHVPDAGVQPGPDAGPLPAPDSSPVGPTGNGGEAPAAPVTPGAPAPGPDSQIGDGGMSGIHGTSQEGSTPNSSTWNGPAAPAAPETSGGGVSSGSGSSSEGTGPLMSVDPGQSVPEPTSSSSSGADGDHHPGGDGGFDNPDGGGSESAPAIHVGHGDGTPAIGPRHGGIGGADPLAATAGIGGHVAHATPFGGVDPGEGMDAASDGGRAWNGTSAADVAPAIDAVSRIGQSEHLHAHLAEEWATNHPQERIDASEIDRAARAGSAEHAG